MIPIKVYVNEDEKQRLTESAELAGMSLSAYVKCLLQKDIKPLNYQKSSSNILKSRVIYVRVTEDEYSTVKKNAGGMTLASYTRMVLLSAGQPVNINIATDDLTEFDWHLSEKLQHFQSMIEVLAYRRTLMPQESEKLLSAIEEIRKELHTLNKETINNRTVIRNAGLRWLRQQYTKSKEKR